MITSEPQLTQGQVATVVPWPSAETAVESEAMALLFAEVNALAIRLRQRSRTQPGSRGELPGAEHAVLDIIDRKGALTVPQIASERSTSRQNIQILVDRLADQGRVELAANPAHKRSALVRLTSKGKMSLTASELGQRGILTQIGSHLSEMEITAVVSVLRKVHSLLLNGQQGGVDQKAATRLVRRPSKGPRPEAAETGPEEFPVSLL